MAVLTNCSITMAGNEFWFVLRSSWAGIAQSVLRLATEWTVRRSNSGEGARFFAPVQTGALRPTQSPVQWVPGGKTAGAWR